jgi:hypothetical protein
MPARCPIALTFMAISAFPLCMPRTEARFTPVTCAMLWLRSGWTWQTRALPRNLGVLFAQTGLLTWMATLTAPARLDG